MTSRSVRVSKRDSSMNGIETAFVGRIANEPEIKTSAAGKPWMAINVALGQGADAQWVRVACFGETAERLAGTLHKGDKLYVEGTLTLRTWEKSGETRAGLNVAASKVEKLGAIGRNRPPKPRALPEGDHTIPASTRRNGDDAARRDWQRPADDVEIPF